MSDAEVDTLKMARLAREAVEDKKAIEPVILDLRGLDTLAVADFFIVCSAASDPQLKAIANGVRLTMKEAYDVLPNTVDGQPSSQWIVVDYGDVIIHVFHQDKRDVYALEDLWGDAPRID